MMGRFEQEMTTIDGDESLTLRLYSLDGIGGAPVKRKAIEYVSSWEDAARMVYDEEWGYDTDLVELQQFEDGEWRTFWGENGESFEELAESIGFEV